mmetsp:Transcript_59791/g.174785  ORF Transcript_59791/g.174785 Transcript_59791/m.174785 type:complete len:203 (+) Transcript_59791:333-941(+)
MMFQASQLCSGSGWPRCTTFSGSNVPCLIALRRRALVLRMRYLPKVWAWIFPRNVRLSCLPNIVTRDSRRERFWRASPATAPSASSAAGEAPGSPRAWNNPGTLLGSVGLAVGEGGTPRSAPACRCGARAAPGSCPRTLAKAGPWPPSSVAERPARPVAPKSGLSGRSRLMLGIGMTLWGLRGQHLPLLCPAAAARAGSRLR